MYYANQKSITVNRDVVKRNTTRLYLCQYQDNILFAMKSLSNSAFKIFILLSFNRPNYTLDYSPAYISQVSGMCIDTARKALSELEEKGYLVPMDEKRNRFDFYEAPNKRTLKENRNEKRGITDPETGEIYYITYESTISAFGKEGFKLWEKGIRETYL